MTRVYFGFDIRGVQRAVSSAQLAVSDFSGPNCPNRALSAQPVTEFTATNNWANPPTPTGAAVPGVWVTPNCPVAPIGVTFDLTTALSAALAAQQTQLWLEVRVPEDHESDPAYRRALFQSSYRLNVELVNTPPATPTRVTNNGNTPCSADAFYTGTDLFVSADQTDADRNPADRLTSEFQYWPVSDPGNVTPVPQGGTSSGGDGVSGLGRIRVDALAAGEYAWHARTYDERKYSDWSAACPFVVDKTAPNTPTIASSEYPENPAAPTGGVGQTGTFLFTANGSDDVMLFRYGTSRTSISERAPADQPGGSATIQWAPWQPGEQSLFVVAYDRAGNASPVREYKINVLTYGVSAWSIGQTPDPAGSRGVVVTWHFETQAGNGLTQIAYSVDGDAEQMATVGADGVVETVALPVPPGEHTLAYSGRDSAGVSHFDTSTPAEDGWTYFFVMVNYADGTTSAWHSFSVTVNG